MAKIGLVVPALFLGLGAFLMISGLTTEGHLRLLGLEMPAKFGTLLGGLGIFAGVAIGIELLGKARKQPPPHVADR